MDKTKRSDDVGPYIIGKLLVQKNEMFLNINTSSYNDHGLCLGSFFSKICYHVAE